ncbi:cytochrome P450 [Crossiella equi]|uniref:Cytochrome P450 n=2 Tax=Crossiella equi TaxID=130796 RepID=A0ABS5AS42_9PSEU|nr:cytochrome P450 [Crossiella equi]MBP2479241.1 cytochrome P450 [Crossiella equi]
MTTAIPAAPGALPLIGHAVPLARRRTEFLAGLAELGGLVRINMVGTPAYVLTDPDLVWRVLVSESRNYHRGRMFDKLTDILGHGLATISGRAHHETRRILQPTFHHQTVAGYAPIMTDMAARIAAKWKPGQTVRIDAEMNDLTARVVNGILFASDMGARAADAIQVRLPMVMKGILTRTLIPGAWQKLPLPANIKYEKSLREMHGAIDEAIAAYRAEGADHSDMLSMLLALRDDDGNPMTDKWIHDQVITVAVGGIETTSAALSWCLHQMSVHPEMEKRVHAELDEVLGGRTPEFADLPKLEYTGKLVLEVLRLHAVAVYMRRTIGETELGPYRLPAGAEIIVSPYALHRNPMYYPDPDVFDPDRWGTEQTKKLPKGAYIPFSAGGSKCIADNFAILEMTLALAVICSKWRLRAHPSRVVKEVTTGATRPNRLDMIVEERVLVPNGSAA